MINTLYLFTEPDGDKPEKVTAREILDFANSFFDYDKLEEGIKEITSLDLAIEELRKAGAVIIPVLNSQQITYLNKLVHLVNNFKESTRALSCHLYDDSDLDLDNNDYTVDQCPLPLSVDEFFVQVDRWAQAIKIKVDNAIQTKPPQQ